MPLTRRVTFKVQLQDQSRFQIPKKVRGYYKLEPSQMIRVTLRVFGLGFGETFLANMLSDGRVTVPRLVMVELKQRMPDPKSRFIEVILEPI